jgi:hypothetical protein
LDVCLVFQVISHLAGTGLLATLNLKPRHLLSMAFILFEPRDDRLEIEVNMNEASMAPFCLAWASRRSHKTLLEDRGPQHVGAWR